MRVYDLTWPISPDAVIPAYLDPPTLASIWRHGEQPASIQRFCTATHLGTHMDAPYHFLPDGHTIEHVPLDRCLGPGIVVDLPSDTPHAVTRAELAQAAERAGGVRRGDRVLLRTGWEERYRTPSYATWPYLDVDAADWLLEMGVALFGADTQGVEQPPALRPANRFAFPIHQRLLGAGVLIVEGLTNLRQVAGRRVMVAAIPLHLVGGDGSPVRAVAWETED